MNAMCGKNNFRLHIWSILKNIQNQFAFLTTRNILERIDWKKKRNVLQLFLKVNIIIHKKIIDY